MSRRKNFTRVISLTSGKGGVGKTNMTVNLAVALSGLGNSVLILDGDLGLANVDILLGLTPKYTLNDVLNNQKNIEDVLVDGPKGVSIIPAASGIEAISNLKSEEKLHLMDELESVALDYDYLLIDTQAGISSDVMYFNSAASEIIVVINNEPTSLTDAYALIKVLAKNYGEKSFNIISNDVRDAAEGTQAFNRLQQVVDRFLKVRLSYLGFVPTDSMVNEAVRQQRALLEVYPSSKAGLAISNIARKIDDEYQNQKVKGGMQFFFRKLLDLESTANLGI
ncbi:MAG: MinD/ParA family protein [bacterium]|nr:MinD/ParA family protein [bacterium]